MHFLVKRAFFNDNAPVHNKASIIILCEQHGIIPAFFEPYSYDYNTIELVFYSAKEYCRLHYSSYSHKDPISKHFENALFNSVSGDVACNYFVRCHVKVTNEERIRAIN